MLRCIGEGCPIRQECYRYTQPMPSRSMFAASPYDPETGRCSYFHSNVPRDEQVRQTAYHIWLRSGRPHGRELEHWYEAYLSLCLSTGRIRSALGVRA